MKLNVAKQNNNTKHTKQSKTIRCKNSKKLNDTKQCRKKLNVVTQRKKIECCKRIKTDYWKTEEKN